MINNTISELRVKKKIINNGDVTLVSSDFKFKCSMIKSFYFPNSTVKKERSCITQTKSLYFYLSNRLY